MQGKSELSNQKMSLMIEIAKIRKNINTCFNKEKYVATV